MSDHSSASSASSASVPSFVDNLNLNTLAFLATNARTGGVACVVDAVPKIGAYNVVYFLEFSDGVRWVARLPIAPWSEALRKRMSLDRISLDFIGTNTTIPVPKIIDCQTTGNNALGRPYILMSFLPGTQLAKLWFDPVWFTDRRRNMVFQALAGLMSQLSTHEFSSIGQLDIDPRTHAHYVGPFYPDLDAISEGETSPEPIRGPYQSTHVCLQGQISDQLQKETSTTVISELHLLRAYAGMIPDLTFDGAPFFLSHPDLGYQNILVDAEGNVTGIVDWDGATIGPRQSAFARYPSWITRDWDPLMYGYREYRESEQEDSPETLSRFRDEYLAAFTRLNPSHGRLTRYSHLIEALEIAISQSFTRAHILAKFTEYIYGGNDDDDEGFLSFVTLSRRLSKGSWVRDTVGEEKLAAGGEYV
ncbi:kinase-like domain-containing protein [Mycena pura]|uniref:Kinase-like domain-containing protein n=1 Tax=Mycena pura TaxID=153505 RepID=A0AAD6YJH5_9AGAR|nr:kinase-like domain-containing protein [Mycena pura]